MNNVRIQIESPLIEAAFGYEQRKLFDRVKWFKDETVVVVNLANTLTANYAVPI